MDVKDLESIIEAGIETQRIDFKQSCKWDIGTFAKDLLAMTNVEHGGIIIIGIEESNKGFVRKGVSKTDKATYVIDKMRDDASSFADPHMSFSCSILKGKDKKDYVAIEVEPFKEVPVICAKDSKDTKKCAIYFRNRNRRIESAVVSSSFDLRDILERSSILISKRWERLGLEGSATVKSKLEEERGNL